MAYTYRKVIQEVLEECQHEIERNEWNAAFDIEKSKAINYGQIDLGGSNMYSHYSLFLYFLLTNNYDPIELTHDTYPFLYNKAEVDGEFDLTHEFMGKTNEFMKDNSYCWASMAEYTYGTDMIGDKILLALSAKQAGYEVYIYDEQAMNKDDIDNIDFLIIKKDGTTNIDELVDFFASNRKYFKEI